MLRFLAMIGCATFGAYFLVSANEIKNNPGQEQRILAALAVGILCVVIAGCLYLSGQKDEKSRPDISKAEKLIIITIFLSLGILMGCSLFNLFHPPAPVEEELAPIPPLVLPKGDRNFV